MKKKRTPPDQWGEILQTFESLLAECTGPVAIGIDMAAQVANCGLCVLVLSDDLKRARLATVLPQAKLNANGSRSPTLLLRPSLQIINQVLLRARCGNRNGSLAVDVPFGWPCAQTQFLKGWSAEAGWQLPNDATDQKRPAPETFAKRHCDFAISSFSGVLPFGVGADKIALASVAWATARSTLAPHLGSIDLGLDNNGPGFFTFETYPGAFVKLVANKFRDYKSKVSVRAQLIEHLSKKYPIDLGDDGEENLVWACNQSGSPDAFDAYLAALSAWDHVRWRLDSNSVTLTTPKSLLGPKLTPELVSEIRREGWILVRTS